MVESNRGKHGRVRSAFGIVKHGGPRDDLVNISLGRACVFLGLGPRSHLRGRGNRALASFPSLSANKGHQNVALRPRRGLFGHDGRDLLGTNIAPLSLDSSAAVWVEAEWIPRDRPLAFF
ncbi:unnamed protein product [Prunus brigantina]